MKEIRVGKAGHVALVDDEDFPRISRYRWQLSRAGYAVRRDGRELRTVYMHRMVIDAPPRVEVDHINRVKLDNTRGNLRLATHAQQMRNQGKRRAAGGKIASSQYRGVSKCYRRWRASWGFEGKKIFIGSFTSEMDAARAYDFAVLARIPDAPVNLPDSAALFAARGAA